MPLPELQASSALDCPFGLENLTGADYIILNHTHGDHIFKLEEIARQFHSTILVHSALAAELARTHELPLSSIYPVDLGESYFLDGFTFTPFHGTHHPTGTYETDRRMDTRFVSGRADRLELNALGGLFNMNFLITTPEGFSVGFWGGNVDGDFEVFARCRPSVLFRNKLHSSKTQYDVAAQWADYLDRSHIPLMVPMHHEKWLVQKPGYTEQLVEEMNHLLRQKGSISRVLNPQRTQWYSLELNIRETEL